MNQAKQGDIVKVHYTGKLSNGEVFDSSTGKKPLTFKLGDGNLISGFENAVLGMAVGQSRSVTIPADEGYGSHNEQLVAQVERNNFPEKIEVKVGQALQIKKPNGEVVNVTITDVSGEQVTLDANHPLAGKDLNFEIELVEIAE
jgi:peptidylprolyl isomerase